MFNNLMRTIAFFSGIAWMCSVNKRIEDAEAKLKQIEKMEQWQNNQLKAMFVVAEVHNALLTERTQED